MLCWVNEYVTGIFLSKLIIDGYGTDDSACYRIIRFRLAYNDLSIVQRGLE